MNEKRKDGKIIMCKFCKTLAVLLAVVTIFTSATTPSLAREFTTVDSVSLEEKNEMVMPYSTNWHLVGNQYKTVAENYSGINGNVYLVVDQSGYNGWEYQMNIIMTDRYGNVVWRRDDATGVFAGGSWWAGPNVAKVQLQIAPRNFFVDEASFWVKSTY